MKILLKIDRGNSLKSVYGDGGTGIIHRGGDACNRDIFNLPESA
ncbi:MAG: hypothetical protein ACKV2V_07675 [Blastocatellia bacterium]